MDRRAFIQNLTATATAIGGLSGAASPLLAQNRTAAAPAAPDIEGHTLICEFQDKGVAWKVYEDLRTRDGAITFVSARGVKVLPKTAEAAFPGEGPDHLGLSMEEIGMSGPDLLADKLLAGGDDPDPEEVAKAAPPQGSPQPPRQGQGPGQQQFAPRARWDTFVGTRERYDTQPVYTAGNTRTYHPAQYFPELRAPLTKRFDGFVGAWMPAARKVFPLSDSAYIEIVVFGDVLAKDKFIVQTWHRTAKIEDGKISKVVYGYTYPAFPPNRVDPKPEEFYRGLLEFAEYWERQIADMSPTTLPDRSWVDMSKHCFAKELLVRPGGVYPKYGAVDRDYYGNEYDGFQDIFTMALYTNLEWGRFEMARTIFDNYFSEYTDAKGMCNMRGPEVAQFGMTLSLLARYFNYTRDAALMVKHGPKIRAIAKMLEAMHAESLKRPQSDPGYGIIHGWSESDACLNATPEVWWLPYYANNGFSARGLFDIGRAWAKTGAGTAAEAQGWLKSAKAMQDTLVATMEKNVSREHTPPYISPFAGGDMLFREGMAKQRPSQYQWTHRPYAELLQADVLPASLANIVVDCMRAYGATTIGVVANVGPARPGARAILGFISYGYAQMLLRLDRVEEYLLFLYAHRYHDHTRGNWTAGEVSGITGGTAIFCIPAQQTIPLLVRWMLVLEDSDEDRLYFAKGVPRKWVASGQPVRIDQAPTRWGKVNFQMIARGNSVVATVELAKSSAPKEVHVKLRVPKDRPVRSVTVNGRPATLGGLHNDTVAITAGAERRFEVVGQL
jgi:hypothetical protein